MEAIMIIMVWYLHTSTYSTLICRGWRLCVMLEVAKVAVSSKEAEAIRWRFHFFLRDVTHVIVVNRYLLRQQNS